MRSIYKYEVLITDRFALRLPVGAEVLSFQVQDERPVVWVMLNHNDRVHELRNFIIIGTGNVFDETKLGRFIGTIQIHAFVWHLFEER